MREIKCKHCDVDVSCEECAEKHAANKEAAKKFAAMIVGKQCYFCHEIINESDVKHAVAKPLADRYWHGTCPNRV